MSEGYIKGEFAARSRLRVWWSNNKEVLVITAAVATAIASLSNNKRKK